jgi:hypothetical protein
MSPERPRDASCNGKQRFDTYSEAERIARRSRRNRDGSKTAYHCQHCNGFHWGNGTPRSYGRRPRIAEEITK